MYRLSHVKVNGFYFKGSISLGDNIDNISLEELTAVVGCWSRRKPWLRGRRKD
jgi:hypothetical protein